MQGYAIAISGSAKNSGYVIARGSINIFIDREAQALLFERDLLEEIVSWQFHQVFARQLQDPS